MSNTRRKHPSDYLLHNEDMDGDPLKFEAAMQLVVAECDDMITDFKLFEPNEYMSQHEIDHGFVDLETLKAAAQEALDIYTEACILGNDDDAREAVMQAFGSSEDEWRKLIAVATEQQDYSRLAI